MTFVCHLLTFVSHLLSVDGRSAGITNVDQECPAVQVVSVCTFLLQWSGCCVQHTDHTGTHVRVQMGWGYGFDMHRGQLDGKPVLALLTKSHLSLWHALEAHNGGLFALYIMLCRGKKTKGCSQAASSQDKSAQRSSPACPQQSVIIHNQEQR